MASSALLREEAAAAREREEAGNCPPAPADLLVPVRSSKEVLRLRLYAALASADCMGLFLAFALANLVKIGDPFASHGMDMLVMLLPIYLGIAVNSRAYSIDVLNQPKAGLVRAGRALIIAIAVVIGTIFYLKVSANFSRAVMALGTAGALASVCGLRWMFGHNVGSRYNWSFTTELLFVDEVPVLPSRGEIVVFADKAELTPSTDDPLLLDRVGQLLKHCDRVVLACPPERRAAWAAMMKGVDVNIEILAPELDSMGALGMGRFNDRSTIYVSHGPLGLRDRMLKRAFDLVLAVSALILLLPAFLFIALAIRLDTPGPVFFRQPRVGRSNRTFQMLKFRSMRAEAQDPHATQLTRVGDDRVTRVGDFLRRTSLDELPQLINVLAGDMSIAGPRPHATGALAGDSPYWEVDRRYWDRHAVKPGITGLAQVRGFRGTTFEHSDLSDRLQADLEYLSGWSIWRDMGIVVATLRVLTHKNAF